MAECNAGSTPCRLRSARHVGARQPASKEPRPKYDFLASVPTIVIIIHVKIHEKCEMLAFFSSKGEKDYD